MRPDGDPQELSPDILIVGGGSAGCVLAARLSEDARLNVLLVEAGPDVRKDSMPDTIRSSYPSKAFFTRSYFFPDIHARFGDVPGVPPRERVPARYEQARVLGGGSTINGLCGNRGAPSDYDEWERLGAAGWGWKEVLPYFRKLERDLDFDDEWHGRDGPVPIRRLAQEHVSGFVRRTVGVLGGQGFEEIGDQNGAWRDGVMRVATNVDEEGCRASAATCYLTASVRARPNLRILTGVTVTRLESEGGRVTGARLRLEDGERLVPARHTILSCGTINTPAILMRSGFGPAGHLNDLGLAVARDIAGVGQGLLEHPALGISCYVRPGNRHLDQSRHHTQAHLRFSSGMQGCAPGDLHMAVIARSAWHAVGARMATFYLWINQAFSRGSVTLASADPDVAPEIDFRLLSDERDLVRMRTAFRRIAELARDPGLDEVRSDVFPMIFSDRVRKVSAPTKWNAFQTAVLAGVLDMSGPLRSSLIRALIAPISMDDILRDDDALDAYLDRAVVGVWHPVGTCRMGAQDDPAAVTGPSGLVHGVPGLRVCDASVMPTTPSANTNIPTIMIAERMADLVKDEMRQSTAVKL